MGDFSTGTTELLSTLSPTILIISLGVAESSSENLTTDLRDCSLFADVCSLFAEDAPSDVPDTLDCFLPLTFCLFGVPGNPVVIERRRRAEEGGIAMCGGRGKIGACFLGIRFLFKDNESGVEDIRLRKIKD